jgi:hypothetical protein
MLLSGTRNRRSLFGFLSKNGERCKHRREEKIKTLLQNCEEESGEWDPKKARRGRELYSGGEPFLVAQ